jgi:putative transposase
MKKKFTEAQIVFALRQAESGTPIAEIIRKMEISEVTFYRWKKKYAGLGVSELRRLKQLDDENRRLKRLVADLTSINRCSRMRYQKSSKARREAGSGVRHEGFLPGLGAAGVHGFKPSSVDDPPREHSGPSNGASHASSGFGDVASRVWI